MVRAVAQKDVVSPRSSQNTPMPWDRQTTQTQEDTFSTREMPNRHSRENSNRDSRDSQRMRIERLGIGQGQGQGQVNGHSHGHGPGQGHSTTTAAPSHTRNDSGGHASSTDLANDPASHSRKHDYDLHAMETTVSNSQLKDTKQTIPSPIVTVRSEYPTLTRSRQQQSLTCLVTIEIPEVKWQPQLEEAQTPPVPPIPTVDSGISIPGRQKIPPSLHVPIDVVVVIPVSSSMQGLKISLLKDSLRFLVANLGERDRMGLVTFGSSGGGVPVVGMTTKTWPGWNKVLNSIRPVGQKSLRADVVEGANVAMDLLMQRKAANPISTILLISDSSSIDSDSVDFVVQRAEAAK
ncbi:hypothetical protein LTR40_008643 [Exophiala xenobiotica]|nr:hypothetical protein LTR40_008643 [Exophiala xenobiotica]